MTESRQFGDASAEAFTRTLTDLGQWRELVQLVGRGEAGVGDLHDMTIRLLREDAPVLSAAAAAVGEQVRIQALAQVKAWRARLPD